MCAQFLVNWKFLFPVSLWPSGKIRLRKLNIWKGHCSLSLENIAPNISVLLEIEISNRIKYEPGWISSSGKNMIICFGKSFLKFIG
jgi:hypothetical protein